MPRRCIFCGGRPVTQEHVFGLWLSSLLSPPPGKKMYVDTDVFVKGQPIRQPRRYPVNIDMKAKQVCRSCNIGWMSKLEEGTMGIISAIHTNAKRSITSEEQHLLASWATKTAIMAQYLNRNPMVPEPRSKWLFKHHRPPPDTLVWIARYDGAGVATIVTNHLFIKGNPERLNAPDGQVVFFSIGILFFVVLSLYIEFKEFRNIGIRTVFPERLKGHLLRICPEDSPLLFWPFEGIDDSLRIELQNLDWGETLRFFLFNSPN